LGAFRQREGDVGSRDRSRLRAVAADQGIAPCAVESLSNFTSRLMEERENNLVMMRAVLDLASDLGGDIVKVFAAWPGVVDARLVHDAHAAGTPGTIRAVV
jgi:sugar phosphate isomerase/epimerase